MANISFIGKRPITAGLKKFANLNLPELRFHEKILPCRKNSVRFHRELLKPATVSAGAFAILRTTDFQMKKDFFFLSVFVGD